MFDSHQSVHGRSLINLFYGSRRNMHRIGMKIDGGCFDPVEGHSIWANQSEHSLCISTNEPKTRESFEHSI